MINLVATGILGLAVASLVFTLSSWRKAYTAAKSTNFPTYLSPVHITDVWFLTSYKLLLPLLDKLPTEWRDPWVTMAQVWNIWRPGHKPFQKLGTDSFILATPGGNLLWTCDPKVISQLETLHPKSQVAVDMLKFYQVYGPNVGSVEGDDGAEWKKHRRVIMSAFDPSTNTTVWQETTRQTQALIQRWSRDDKNVNVMKEWTSRLALHVISAVFFRKNLTWTEASQNKEPMPDGHELPFDKAIFQVVENLGLLCLIPRALLSRIPLRSVKAAHLAFTEYTQYLCELRGEAVAHADDINKKTNKSIVESIVMAATMGEHPLAEDSILGNIFFTLVAGHETTGNTMAFALNILALYPEYQSKIHEDLDRALAKRVQEEWTVEREYQTLQKGWIGAVLKEILRLYCVVQFVPRQIVAPINVVDSEGIEHAIPAKTLCLMNFAATFRNPNVWPQRDLPAGRREELHDCPALDFNPEQWLVTEPSGSAESVEEGAAVLQHFPFGQGPHVCPGRLFAQVEMVAAVATVLIEHKLELVVDKETLASCGGNLLSAREKTRDNAYRKLVDDIESNVSVQLLKPLPLRLVDRA